MRKIFPTLPILFLMLSACYEPSYSSSAFPTHTSGPSSTAVIETPTSTSVPTSIPSKETSPTPTLTSTLPYRNIGIIFDYYIAGNQADWDPFFDPPSGNIITKLVLYDDGQMLLAGGDETFGQKILTSEEINSLLSKLEELGFYTLESTQKHDVTDKLYNFQGKYDEVDVLGGLRCCISVNTDRSRKLCVHGSYLEFLIPEMKNILQFLDEYEPTGMTAYSPDRVLLSIQGDFDPSLEELPLIPWDEHFPSLEKDIRRFTSDTSNQVIYVDGRLAEEIYLFFGGTDTRRVSQQGKEYIVYLRVLLPHENVKHPHHKVSFHRRSQPGRCALLFWLRAHYPVSGNCLVTQALVGLIQDRRSKCSYQSIDSFPIT